MAEYVISCGCGRRMQPNARAGADSYRCGCGAQIRVQPAPARSRLCWYDSCNEGVITEAPLAFCEEHQRDTVNRLAHLIVRFDWGAVLAASDAVEPFPRSPDGYRQNKPAASEGWVYFMRRERLIKIGTTTNLARRATAIGAAVLARIPGGYTEEAQLHARFASLRQHGEWFEPGPELLNLINRIRADDGRPPIKAEG